MSFLPVYLDASAIVKLIVVERETDALFAALVRWPDRVTAAVSQVEVRRALWRVAAPARLHARADAVLASLALLRIDDAVLSRAASLKDRQLRARDAIHLAAALSLGDDPDAFITYEARLAHAATRQRLTVQHPGVDRLE